MKQIVIKALALLLACMMLCSALASCVDSVVENETTDTESESASETATESTSETETKTETQGTESNTDETETENGGDGTDEDTDTETTESVSLDYIPVELESRLDNVPDYEGYETLAKDYLQPYSVWVEGENYTATSVSASKYSSPGKSGGYVFYSGGSLVPEEWKSPNFDITKFDKKYQLVYEITVPASGYYKLITVAGDRDHRDTTDFTVIIDDKVSVHCLNGTIVEEVPSGGDSLGALFQMLDLGAVYLTRGEHRVVFDMDLEDAYNDKPGGEDRGYGRICFMMDYFVLNRVYSDNDAPVVTYDADISNDPNAELLKAAAKINVFDASYPIHINYVHFFEETGRGNYTITDYQGNVIYRKYFTGEANDIRQVEIGIKNHPTGYFILQAGDYVEYYTVVPPLETRTTTDSPFVIDGAFTQLIRNVDRIESYAATFRMLGVTWTRERMSWASYQKERVYDEATGKYVYTYSDAYMELMKKYLAPIKDAGLNVLLAFSTGPTWAKELGMNIHPDSQVTSGNYLGTYDTQLAIYEATKKAAAELDGYVDIIELMNEPDHTFRDIAEHYAGWFKAAALGVIDSGSDMAISLSGLCQPTNWRDFLALILNSDVMDYSSIFNFHSHADLPSDTSVTDYGNSINMRTFPQVMELYGNTKPVWISESGMKLPSETPTDEHKQKQAPYIVTSAVQSLSYGVDKYFWFVGAPYLEAGGDYGSFSPNDRAYPVMAAYAVMTDVLGEGKYIGELKDLPENGRGYLIDTGDRIVAVVWRTKGTSAYIFNADAPVLVTSMMGEQKLRTPNDKGQIAINISTDPVYITYSKAPEDYYAHSYEEPDEIVQPTVDFGDRIVLTPEFDGFIFDTATKDGGHYIADGSIINVRVVNHNDVAVTGKISVTIPGFEISGLDTEVTVQPHEEEFVTLMLKKSGEELYDDHVLFTGKFWDATKTEAEGVACSPTAANVHATDKKIARNIYFTLSGNISGGKKVEASALKDATIYVDRFMPNSSVKVLINGEEFTNYTFVEAPADSSGVELDAGLAMILTMDLSSLEAGKYAITVASITEGGDVQVLHLYLRYDGETAKFTSTW